MNNNIKIINVTSNLAIKECISLNIETKYGLLQIQRNHDKIIGTGLLKQIKYYKDNKNCVINLNTKIFFSFDNNVFIHNNL